MGTLDFSAPLLAIRRGDCPLLPLLDFDGFLPIAKRIQSCGTEESMKSTFATLRGAAGTGALLLIVGGLVLSGYVLLNSIGDLKRYIRISTM
jgi:hypothetical protein